MSTHPTTAVAANALCHDTTLRALALRLIRICDPHDNAAEVRAHGRVNLVVGADHNIEEPVGVPGRPERPPLLEPRLMPQRAVGSQVGRAALVHALTHIEANAINLALDLVWRFRGLPDAFYRDWWQVAVEEARHFQLLHTHLKSLGYAYGDFPAHDGLWEMARRTRDDVLARLALVPRTLEARGLDATPAVRNKLISVGDTRGAEILAIILRDEIRHVEKGNRWYRSLCSQQQLDPVGTYACLAQRYGAPRLHGPFNLPARRAAGFTEEELTVLCDTSPRACLPTTIP